MEINPHTLIHIISVFFSLACGIFVIVNNHKCPLNRQYFIVCINIFVWLSINIPVNFPSWGPNVLELWSQISYCAISFMPISSFSFVTEYLNFPQHKAWYRINIIIGLIFSVLILTTNYFIDGIDYTLPWHPFPKAGPLNFIQILHCIYLCFFMVKFTFDKLKERNLSLLRLNRLRYLLAATIVMGISPLDYFLMYGFHVYQIGGITCGIYLIIVGIAILKHQLLDIRFVIKKGLVYSLLVSAITFTYLFVMLIAERVLHSQANFKTITSSLGSAIFIALVFTPLRNLIQKIIDKLFFKESPEKIANENERLRKEIIQTEKLKSVALLASGLAHEIKNPLTALKTFGEYLPQKADDKEFIKKFSPIINQEISRIDGLVHELLDFAKPSPVDLKPANVNALLDSTLEFLNNDLIKNRIKLFKEFQTNFSLRIYLDHKQFKQALLNLLLNAIEAMPNGGTLTITTNKTIDNSLLIKIQDTGEGINKSDLPYIFDPFFTKKDQGTGLGLAITHEIIKNHNGKIHVESVLGGGTIFTIELPI